MSKVGVLFSELAIFLLIQLLGIYTASAILIRKPEIAEIPQISLLAFASIFAVSVIIMLLAIKYLKHKFGFKMLFVFLIVIGSRIVQNENFLIPLMLTSLLLLVRYLKATEALKQTKKNWQRNLAALLAGLLTLAKVPWSFVTLAGCLLLSKQKKFKDAFIFGLIAVAVFSLYFLYGRIYDWPTFISLWGLQMARARIGLETVLALFIHPFLVDRTYPDGWIYFGWVAVLFLSREFKKHSLLLIPFLSYFLIFVFAIPGIEAQGWYRYPFYPFLTIALAVIIKEMLKKTTLLNLFFFFFIAASAFHWGWGEKFGFSNNFFRTIMVLGTLSFLPAAFWPEKFAKLGKKATCFWLIIFLILNLLSVTNHFHS